jgi:hypothetical protein
LDTISLRIEEEIDEEFITIQINGKDFSEVIGESGLGGFPIFWLDKWPSFMTVDPQASSSHSCTISVCNCGQPACSSVGATVVYSDDTVTWKDFTGLHEKPKYAYHPYDEARTPCQPMVFQRAQYEAEITKIRGAIKSTYPPASANGAPRCR